jgi:hypothetical protein
MTTEMNQTSIKIPATALDRLSEIIAKANKKAKRIGVEPLSFKVVDQTSEALTDEHGNPIRVLYAHIVINGEAPITPDWNFIGKLTHMKDSDGNYTNVCHTRPDVVLPERFRTVGPACDHCGRTRSRLDTFVLFNDRTSEYIQIGRSCLGEILDNKTIESMTMYAEWLSVLDEFRSEIEAEEASARAGGVPTSRGIYDLVKYLSFVAMMIRKHGWVSSAKAYDSRYTLRPLRSTASEAYQMMLNSDRYYDDMTRALQFAEEQTGIKVEREIPVFEYDPTPEDAALVSKVIEWAANQSDSSEEYIQNLHVIAKLGAYQHKQMGLVASMVAAYQNAEKRAAQQEKVEKGVESQWIGEVGKRMEITAKLTNRRSFDNDYGTSYMYTFEDANGNSMVYFTANPLSTTDANGISHGLEVGVSYAFKAGIKEHSEFRGTKQTRLQRILKIALA